MRPVNTLTITGNLARDAEHSVTRSGQDMCRFNIGYTHRRKNQAGQWEDAGTTWVNVTVFDRQAQDLAHNLRKGTGVLVTGPVEHRQYEKRDGTTGFSLDVIADSVAIRPRFQQAPQQAGDTWNTSPAADDEEPPF